MSGKKGQSGRQPKTKNEKQKLGNYRHDRFSDNEPERVAEKPQAFGELSEEAQKVWDHYAPMLYNNGTLSATDAMALTMLCETAARWYHYSQLVKQYGEQIPVKDKEGNVTDTKIATRSRLERYYRNDLDGMLRQFGLNPLARSSIQKLGDGDDPKPIKSVT